MAAAAVVVAEQAAVVVHRVELAAVAAGATAMAVTVVQVLSEVQVVATAESPGTAGNVVVDRAEWAGWTVPVISVVPLQWPVGAP